MHAISKWWLTWLAAGVSVAAFAEPPSIRMPEIRRVLLSPDQVPAELEKVQRGALRSVPLAEFEDLLRRATQADSPREMPSLLAAKYHCRWENGDLVGTANLTIRHSAREPGFLKLDPFSVAIRSARWSDDRPALIGDFASRANGSKCSLIIDHPGDQQMNLTWSARGIREPNGA